MPEQKQHEGLTPSTSTQRGYRHRVQVKTLWILALTQIIGTVGVGVAPSVGILLAEEVTTNETWAGLARTASTLGAALLGLPLGKLASRHGRRISLASGWWLAAIGAGLLVPAAQFRLVVPLFVGLLLIGAGSAVSLQARFAATDLANDEHKGRNLALIVWVGTVGTVLGPNLGIPGKAIGESVGLNVFAGAFLIAGVGMGIAGAIVFAGLRPDPLLLLKEPMPARAAVKSRGKERKIRRLLTEISANRQARFAVSAIISAQIVMVAVMTMTPIHVTHHGGSVTLVGITISLHILGMYAFSPIVGLIVDRYKHPTAVIIGLIFFAAALLSGSLRQNDMGWIIASLIFLGLGWSFINVAGSALFATAVTSEIRASAQGGLDTMSNLSGAAAALIAGPIMAISSFASLVSISAVALVPLAVQVLRLPKTDNLREDSST